MSAMTNSSVLDPRSKVTRARRQTLREALRRKLFLEQLEDRRLLAGLDEAIVRGLFSSPTPDPRLTTADGQPTIGQWSMVRACEGFAFGKSDTNV